MTVVLSGNFKSLDGHDDDDDEEEVRYDVSSDACVDLPERSKPSITIKRPRVGEWVDGLAIVSI